MATEELDKDATGKEEVEEAEMASATAACSICLEEVTNGGDRSTARLQCGHKFHLDCIGSAFNAKGSMQCPNCRKVEKGNWLYANGSHLSPEYSIDDWTRDEDLYDLSYPGMPFGFHWYPFGVARIPSLFLEGDSSHTVAFQDFFRHHANYAEHPPTTSASNPCPYLAYLLPFQPSPPSHPHASSERNGDSPSYHNQWSHSPRLSDVHTLRTVGPGSQYCCLEYHPHSYSPSGVHGSVVEVVSPSTTFRTMHDSSGPLTGGSTIPPAVHNHRYGSRVGFNRSFVPSVPQARAEDGAEHYLNLDSQGAHENHTTGASQSRVWISGVDPNNSSHPFEQTGLFLFPPPPFSDRNTTDAMNSGRSNLHHLPSFPTQLLARESGWWPSPQNFVGFSDSSNRMPLCPQSTSDGRFLPDRPESIPRRPMPVSQMNSMFSTL